ncbi:hypothetical protein B4U80_05749 [Leptotrombidium deliense]|uniref:Chitin-binding type-2 domain-containing protein n=1 Tax=Leptotrombidium deliense TaxID=299467 RepID=A0A443SMX9_9ACAR|nr:hypothetical protein B4U80_05749 [Leptotrombidium deliense]
MLHSLLLCIFSVLLFVKCNSAAAINSEKDEFVCESQFGAYPDKNDCSKFWLCVAGKAHHKDCKPGYQFSAKLSRCTKPEEAECKIETTKEKKLGAPLKKLPTIEETVTWLTNLLIDAKNDHSTTESTTENEFTTETTATEKSKKNKENEDRSTESPDSKEINVINANDAVDNILPVATEMTKNDNTEGDMKTTEQPNNNEKSSQIIDVSKDVDVNADINVDKNVIIDVIDPKSEKAKKEKESSSQATNEENGEEETSKATPSAKKHSTKDYSSTTEQPVSSAEIVTTQGIDAESSSQVTGKDGEEERSKATQSPKKHSTKDYSSTTEQRVSDAEIVNTQEIDAESGSQGTTEEDGEEETSKATPSAKQHSTKDYSSITEQPVSRESIVNTQETDASAESKRKDKKHSEQETEKSVTVDVQESTTNSTENSTDEYIKTVTEHPNVNVRFECPEENGMFPHTKSCHLFYHCSNNISFVKLCPGNLHWSKEAMRCEWPDIANCTLEKSAHNKVKLVDLSTFVNL